MTLQFLIKRIAQISIFIVILSGGVATASAATWYANSFTGSDANDGTLVAPFQTFHQAYTAASSGDTIVLDGTFTWTDAAEAGDVEFHGYNLAKSLTITGQGADTTIIQAASDASSGTRRIFTIKNGAVVTIQGLTIRYGRNATSFSGTYGGGILVEAGGNLTVDDSRITQNYVSSTSWGGYGGGINNTGTLLVRNTVIDNNFAFSQGGGINNAYIAENNNTATLVNVTIAYNAQAASVATIGGSGIHLRSGSMNILNSTIAYNDLQNAGTARGAIQTNGGTLVIKNSIVAHNLVQGSPVIADAGFYNDIYHSSGGITDSGNNIFGKPYNFTVHNESWFDKEGSGVGDGVFQKKGNLGLSGSLDLAATLALNGAENNTVTLAIESETSIAVDNGSVTGIGIYDVPSTDQRGLARVGTADIGAFEYGATPVLVPPQVTVLSPEHGATDVAVDANLVMTFDKESGADSGTITIYDASDDSVYEVIDVAGGPITGNGTTTLTIDPVNNFEEGETYYVLISETAIRANDGAYFVGIDDENTWRFTTEDITPPSLVTLSPADNATGVVFNPTLEMTFDEPVVFDNGTIEVVRAHDHQLIALIPVSGGIPNTTVPVSFLEILDPATEYYVIVSETAIADVSGNNFEGILNGVLWTFTTRNVNDPILTSPTNNSAHQSLIEIEYEIFESHLANSLQLVFIGDETITINLVDVAVGQHSFTLDTNNIAASIAVASSSQNTIPDGVYDVTLRHKDLLDSVTLSITSTDVIIDTTAPTLDSLAPVNGAIDISPTGTLSLVFDELVGWAAGEVVIYHGLDDTVFETITVGGGPVSGSGTNTLTIDPLNDFAQATEYYVLIDNGAIRDLVGNNYAGIADQNIWRFTTGSLPQQSRQRTSSGSSAVSRARAQEVWQNHRAQQEVQQTPVLSPSEILQKLQALKDSGVVLPPILDALLQGPTNTSDGGVASPIASEIPDTCVQETLRVGFRSDCVRLAQQVLKVAVDGWFGRQTESAVRDFQTKNGLQADGIVGKNTWGALRSNG